MDKPSPFDAVGNWLSARDWTDAGLHLAAALAILVGAFLLSKLMRVALDRLRGRLTVSAPAIYMVEQIGGYLILLVGALIAVSTLGVDLASLAIFGGAVGVGLGLGLQGIVKEFVSGLVLIFDPAIQVGDYIEVDDSVRGEIVEIGPRATRLRTNDDLNVVIPNSSLIQNRVTNWTYNTTSRRMHVPFSVAEESDIARVRDVVLAAATALPFTLANDDVHKNQVWLTDFSGGKLDFDLVVWPAPESSRHPRAMHAAYTWAIYRSLVEAGIRAADPRMDIRLTESETSKAVTARPHPSSRPTENDAASAVYDDADRSRRLRESEPRKRDRPAAG
ncbi:mechanosensitive ion channel family protein [Brevundimonas goettingensis]|uniref:Mechanosensitive ion channel n=1 Tax=Brevundimonas goettingensis TaxID=2774190 RepID=A0A975C2M7_9CAUL|nr:mechanosensitive ion channel domain-containing protein [Brevundimonas goettingensis]QTC92748.1 mechanosensitive ion channel [Brevundimonas goettingensis]